MDFLLDQSVWPFTAALLLVGLIGIVEALGLGLSALELDLHIEHDVEHAGFLHFLGVGQVPLMAVLIVLLSSFGAAGLTIQSIFHLPVWMASVISFLASLPLTGVLSGLLAKVWPQDETTIVGKDELLAKRATIISGRAIRGNPAEAKVYDVFGQPHYILVEPSGDTELIAGDIVLLVAREGNTFTGVDPTGGFRPIEER